MVASFRAALTILPADSVVKLQNNNNAQHRGVFLRARHAFRAVATGRQGADGAAREAVRGPAALPLLAPRQGEPLPLPEGDEESQQE